VKHILHQACGAVLTEFAHTNPLVAFDFDGTLAPIVRERDQARMRASTALLLLRVCQLFPTAVISGRSRADVAARLSGAPVKHIVGNHGLEPAAGMPGFELSVMQMRPEIVARLHAQADVEIEDKRYSLAIHYRKATAKRKTRDAILRATAALASKPRVVLGKLVINLLPEGAPNKGTALEELRTRENASTAIYVGDDMTDEDAFVLARSGRVLGIRVGRERASAAPYFLRSQDEIDALLVRLVELRGEESRA